MNSDQKTVAVGAASGVICMALAVWGLYTVMPNPGVIDMAERLAFALQLNVVALVPLFILLISVGNQRFFSNAIDPLRHEESQKMEVDGRVVENTLEQQFVFLVGTLALTTLVPPGMLKVIPALVTIFITARVLFWIGYRIHPLYRAPGMAATAYMNLGIILTVLYLKLFI